MNRLSISILGGLMAASLWACEDAKAPPAKPPPAAVASAPAKPEPPKEVELPVQADFRKEAEKSLPPEGDLNAALDELEKEIDAAE
jgi:hypothetical protein